MNAFSTPTFLKASALALAVLAAGCGRGNSESVDDAGAAATPAAAAISPAGMKPLDITIDNFSYSPATLTIHAGQSVTWVNHDDVPHTVTANDKSFDSKAMDTDARYTHVFTTPGTYAYFCAVHPHMTAQIIVK